MVSVDSKPFPSAPWEGRNPPIALKTLLDRGYRSLISSSVRRALSICWRASPRYTLCVGGGTIINYYRGKARHELSVAQGPEPRAKMTKATPKEEIFRYASVPDDGRVRGAALKPQGARSFRVQGGHDWRTQVSG